MANSKLAISIDFGTSRSAVCYKLPDSDDVFPYICENYVVSQLEKKAETVLLLNKTSLQHHTTFGTKARIKYADGAHIDHHMFTWFKMHLKSLKSSEDNPFIASISGESTVRLKTLITQALIQLSDDAMKRIPQITTDGNKKKSDIFWVITVPVIWSEAADLFMRKACVAAGLVDNPYSLNLLLANEAEAACHDFVDSIRRKNCGINISEGSSICLVDCGGGTCDVMFLKFLSTDPIRVQEICSPTGNDAGATKIDKAFLDLLQAIFGEMMMKKLKALPAYVKLMLEFEALKITFGTQDPLCRIDLTSILDEYSDKYDDEITRDKFKTMVELAKQKNPQLAMRAEGKKLEISNEMLGKWFSDVVNPIKEMIRSYLNKPECKSINVVYMVGGFSSSLFVQKSIKDMLKSQFPGVQFMLANRPDFAIVRGSAMIDNQKSFMQSRVQNAYYGIEVNTAYNPTIHLASKKVENKSCSVPNRVYLYDIFVRQNQRIEHGWKTSVKSYVPLYEAQAQVSFTLYKMVLPENNLLKESEIVYGDDPRLEKQYTVTAEVDTSIPFGQRTFTCQIQFGERVSLLIRDDKGRLVDGGSCIVAYSK